MFIEEVTGYAFYKTPKELFNKAVEYELPFGIKEYKERNMNGNALVFGYRKRVSLP